MATPSAEVKKCLMAAKKALDAKEWKEVVKAAKQALAADPETSAAYLLIGYAANQMGELVPAEKSYRKAATMSETDPKPWQGLIEVFSKSGDDASLIESCKKALGLMTAAESGAAAPSSAAAAATSAQKRKDYQTKLATALLRTKKVEESVAAFRPLFNDLKSEIESQSQREGITKELVDIGCLFAQSLESLQLKEIEADTLKRIKDTKITFPSEEVKQKAKADATTASFSSISSELDHVYHFLLCSQHCQSYFSSPSSELQIPLETFDACTRRWLTRCRLSPSDSDRTFLHKSLAAESSFALSLYGSAAVSACEAILILSEEDDGYDLLSAEPVQNASQFMAQDHPDRGLGAIHLGLSILSSSSVSSSQDQPEDQEAEDQDMPNIRERKSVEAFERGLRQYPLSLIGWLGLSLSSLKIRDFHKAEDAARKGLLTANRRDAPPVSCSTLRLRSQLAQAQALYGLKKLKEAQDILQSLNGNVEAMSLLANVLLDVHQYEASRSLLKRLIAALPSASTASLPPLLRFTASIPSHADVLSRLGWTTRCCGDLMEASALLQSAVEILSEDAVVHRRLAIVLWEQAPETEAKKQECLSHLLRSAKLDPSEGETFKYLGQFYASIGEEDRARKCFTRAVELNPLDADSGIKLCQMLSASKQINLAVAICRAAANKSPFASWAFLRLGFYHLSQLAASADDSSTSTIPEAIHCFQQSLRTDPLNASAWEGLGKCYQMEGKHVAALRSFERALQLNPQGSIQALYHTATIELSLGMRQEAANHLADIVRNHPSFAPAYKLLADQLFGDAKECMNRGLFHAARDELKKAASVMRQGLKYDPKMVSGWKLLGDIQCMSQETSSKAENSDIIDEAIDAYRHGIGLAPEDGSLLHDLAIALSLKHRFSPAADLAMEAEHSLRTAIAMNPTCSQYWYSMAVLSPSSSSSPSQRQHCLIRCLQLDSKNRAAWDALAVLYMQHKKPALARQALSQAQSADPEATSSWTLLGLLNECFTSASNTDEILAKAASAYTHASSLDINSSSSSIRSSFASPSSFAATLLSLSFARFVSSLKASDPQKRLKDVSEACSSLRKYLVLNPNNAAANNLFALCLERLNQLGEAKASLQLAERLLEDQLSADSSLFSSPPSAFASSSSDAVASARTPSFELIGASASVLTSEEESTKSFLSSLASSSSTGFSVVSETAANLKQKHFSALKLRLSITHRNLARVLACQGQYTDAIQVFEKETVVDKELYAFCLSSVGKHDDAIRVLTTALEEEQLKDKCAIYMALARTAVAKGQMDKAQSYAEEAIRSDANHASCPLLLTAFICQMRGDTSKCDKLWEVAKISSTSVSTTCTVHLIAAQLESLRGNSKAMLASLQAAVHADPSNPHLLSILGEASSSHRLDSSALSLLCSQLLPAPHAIKTTALSRQFMSSMASSYIPSAEAVPVISSANPLLFEASSLANRLRIISIVYNTMGRAPSLSSVSNCRTESVSSAQRSLLLNPSCLVTRRRLAEALISRSSLMQSSSVSDAEAAVSILRELIASAASGSRVFSATDLMELKSSLCDALILSNCVADATTEARSAIQSAKAPEQAIFYRVIARCLVSRQELEKAGKALEKALLLSPSAEVLSELANVLFRQGRAQSSILCVQRAIDLVKSAASPTSPAVLCSLLTQLAFFTLVSGNVASALDHAKLAVEADAHSAPAHLLFGLCLLESGDMATAELTLARCRELDPSITFSGFCFYRTQYSQEKWEDAERTLWSLPAQEKELSSITSSKTLFEMAKFASESNSHVAAFKFQQRALLLDPSNSHQWELLGMYQAAQ